MDNSQRYNILLGEIQELQGEKAILIQSRDILAEQVKTHRETRAKISTSISLAENVKHDLLDSIKIIKWDHAILLGRYKNDKSQKQKDIQDLDALIADKEKMIEDYDKKELIDIDGENEKFMWMIGEWRKEVWILESEAKNLKKDVEKLRWEKEKFTEWMIKEKKSIEKQKKTLKENQKRIDAYKILLHKQAEDGKD